MRIHNRHKKSTFEINNLNCNFTNTLKKMKNDARRNCLDK